MPHAATLLERGTLPPSLSGHYGRGALYGRRMDYGIMAAPTTKGLGRTKPRPCRFSYWWIRKKHCIPNPGWSLGSSPQLCSRHCTASGHSVDNNGHSHRLRAQLRQQHFQHVRRGAGTRAATVVPRVVGLLRLLCLEDHMASAACTKGAGFPAHGRRWLRPNDSPSTTGNATTAR